MAGVRPDEVQAFCAHGTGTVFNDSMELAAVEAVFGERRFPVFSIKGAIGHTLGAAGGIDAAVCVNALAERQLPPTAGLESPEPRAEGRVSRYSQAFEGGNILTSNSGFGGINAALLVSAVPDHGGVSPVAASRRPLHVFSEPGRQRKAAVEQRVWPHGRAPGSSVELGAIHVLGGGWVSAAGYGRMGDGTKAVMTPGIPADPPTSEIYAEPPLRFRRFDSYCRIGCAAIALALQDAGMDRAGVTRPIGIIASTRYGCFETDLAFQGTAGEKNGIYASPGLFSYTLPGIAISEAAILFQLTGPTFTVGDPVRQRGCRALEMAVDLITSGTCPAVLAGWLDAENCLLRRRADDDDGLRGAVFVVLSAEDAPRKTGTITQKGSKLLAESGMRISTILDLVG
jgi:3-oxoacyl-(acyl-carrier-protein) synthase